MQTELPKFPNKPSELLELAYSSFILAETDPTYEINMENWHTVPLGKTVTSVCFSGSIIAKYIKSDPKTRLHPNSFGSEINVKLRAIDKMSRGDLSLGLRYLGINYPMDKVRVTPYHLSKEEFKSDIQFLILLLKEDKL